MYFDKRFKDLTNTNKIIDISRNDIIYYNEQIINIKKGQRLIIQIE